MRMPLGVALLRQPAEPQSPILSASRLKVKATQGILVYLSWNGGGMRCGVLLWLLFVQGRLWILLVDWWHTANQV